jgi:hypothetical protein
VSNPLSVNWAELAVDLPNQTMVSALSEINTISQLLCGFVKRGVRGFWR